MLYEKSVFISFRHTDQAQRIYFAELFNLAHDVYESFIIDLGINWADWFKNPKFHVAIRHTEADFHSAFLPGHTYKAELGVSKIGNSSFTIEVNFLDGPKLCGKVTSVHVFVEPEEGRKTSIPTQFRELLGKYFLQ